MLLVGGHRREGPFDPFFKGMFADIAALFHTDAAGEVETGIGMDKEFHGLPETAPDERGERIDLRMRLEHIEVPGQGQMTVDMQAIPIFDYPQIVEIDPILPAMRIQISDQVLQ